MGKVIAAAMLTASLISCACSNNRGDPMAAGNDELKFGGSLSNHFERANALVTQETLEDLCDQTFLAMYSSIQSALLASGLVPDSEDVRILGNICGYGIADTHLDSIYERNGKKVAFGSQIVFHDFSADGKLFVAGRIGFKGTWAEVNRVLIPQEIWLNGGLEYAGDYSGAMYFFGFTLLVDENGQLIKAGSTVKDYPAEGFINFFDGEDVLFSVVPYVEGGGDYL